MAGLEVAQIIVIASKLSSRSNEPHRENVTRHEPIICVGLYTFVPAASGE